MLNIDDEHASTIISSFKIPPKPQVLIDIQTELNREDLDLSRFAEIISGDVAMSGAILKTINSPRFGFNRAVTDIKQSVVMLGVKFMTAFATHFAMLQVMNKPASISMEKFWDTATETANIMLMLIDHLDLKRQCPKEDAYSFGMFRDSGIPLMAMKYDDYNQVLIEANQTSDKVFTDIEEATYTTNHAVIGYLLTNSWHFPKALCNLVLRHHEPDYLHDSTVNDKDKYLFALSKVAANYLNIFNTGHHDCEWKIARESVLSFLHLSDIEYMDLKTDILEQYGEIVAG
jgi:HD-like signal output (HDOD) protein